MNARPWSSSVRAVLFCAVAASAGAQQARDDGGAARLQAMVSQLTAERTQLQAENKDVKAKLEAANGELKKIRDQNADLTKRLSQSETSLAQSSASNTRSTEQNTQLRSRMDELVKQFRETIENLKKTELERNDLKTMLAAREAVLGTCVTNNDKLFATGNEILDRYEAKGCFASAREKEPFTQLKRVQLQNLVDEYRWKLEDEHLPDASRGAVSGSSAPAGAAGHAAEAASDASARPGTSDGT